MKRGVVVLGCLVSLFTLNNSHAENIRLDEVVVTATRSDVQRSQVPAAVTVITAGDIEEKHVSTVPELLRDIAGVDVSQQGGAGKTTSVFIRGAESRHTLVLIDGIRANSPATSSFDFADLTVENIERIEIIRGPMSTLYGSDAIGGVIQIFTKKARTSSASVSFEGGSYGTSKETVSTEIKHDNHDLTLSVFRMDTDGFSASKAGSEKDGYKNTTISSRIGIYPQPDTRIEITARLTEARTELDGFNADDLNYQQERQWSVIGISGTSVITSNWNQKLSLSSSNDRLVGLDDDTPFNRYRINMANQSVDWQHNVHINKGEQLTFGYEGQHKEGRNQGGFNKGFYNHAIYVQDQNGLDTPVQLLAGIRWDDSTIYESALTYRFGISYMQAAGVKWHAQYGTGFNGPTLNDLFWPEDPYSVGNPNLKPEKSNGWEIGAEQGMSDNMSMSINYFQNTFKDLIQWIPNSSGKWQPQNRAQADSRGIDTDIKWLLSPMFIIDGNYTYNDTQDSESHFYLQRRPLNKYSIAFRLNPAGSTGMTVNIIHVGRRVEWADTNFDGIPDQQNTMSAYSRVDLSLSSKIGKNSEIFGRVENLFDKKYEEAIGYNTAGVSTYGGVRIAF